MKEVRLLIYEDDATWVKGFEFNIKPRFKKLGIDLKILHKLDDQTIIQDLEFMPDLILVDFDLGKITGETVIEKMQDDPQLASTSVYFYSGGESIEALSKIANSFSCGISCFTKEGSELIDAIIQKVK